MNGADGDHGVFVVTAVGIPMLFVLIMHLLEVVIEGWDWRKRMMRVGWDSCVLAMGGIGGIMAEPRVQSYYGPWGNTYLIIALALNFAGAIIIVILRKGERPSGLKALIALAVGGAALAFPAYAAFHR
jgi:hypothetical protein